MSFSQLRAQISSELERIHSIQDYKRLYLSIAVIQSIEQLNKKFIEHLFQDLLNKDLDINIRAYLKESETYQIANDFALECIEPAFYKTHIHGSRIKEWTSSALKSFDIFLIKLINDYLNEKIKKNSSKIYETDVYVHLEDKGGNYYDIGSAFKAIYQTRSSFTHVQYETIHGKRKIKGWSRSKYDYARDLIFEQFEKGLKSLVIEIKKHVV